MRFSNSMDDVRRVNVRVEFRLSVHDLASVLANHVNRQGIDLDGYGYATGLDEIRNRFMVFTKVMPLIRDDLRQYGENATVFDGDREMLEWAVNQVEAATGEKNTEGV